MNKKLFLSFLFIAFLSISGTAQTNLIGKYSYQMSIDEGRNTLDLIFELKTKNVAVYRNEQNGEETQRRSGSWTYSKKLNQITVFMPPVQKNPIMGQEVKLTFVFKVVGNDLKLIRDLPYKDGKGEVYQKRS